MRIEVVGSTSLSSQLEGKTDNWESCCFLFSPHEDVENGELGDWDLVHEPGDQILGLKSPMEVTLTLLLHLRTMVKVVGVRLSLVQEKPAMQQSGMEPRFTCQEGKK